MLLKKAVRSEKVDIAHKYGLKKKTAPKLTVAAGTKHVLDAQSDEDHFHSIEIKSLDRMKAVLGHPDALWMGEHPRFGMKPANPPPGNPKDEESLTPDARAAMREYVYGNSRCVASWKAALEKIVAQSTVAIGIWNFSDVTVEHDSVLVVNSNGLFCDHLYAHATGKIIVSHGGPCLIEMNTYVPIHDVSGGGGEWWPAPGGVGHPPSAARRVT